MPSSSRQSATPSTSTACASVARRLVRLSADRHLPVLRVQRAAPDAHARRAHAGAGVVRQRRRRARKRALVAAPRHRRADARTGRAGRKPAAALAAGTLVTRRSVRAAHRGCRRRARPSLGSWRSRRTAACSSPSAPARSASLPDRRTVSDLADKREGHLPDPALSLADVHRPRWPAPRARARPAVRSARASCSRSTPHPSRSGEPVYHARPLPRSGRHARRSHRAGSTASARHHRLRPRRSVRTRRRSSTRRSTMAAVHGGAGIAASLRREDPAAQCRRDHAGRSGGRDADLCGRVWLAGRIRLGSPRSGALWMADHDADGSSRLRTIAPEHGSAGGKTRGVVAPSLRVAGIDDAFVRRGVIGDGCCRPSTGSLLVASEGGRHLLRVALDPETSARPVATERLLQDRVGGVAPSRLRRMARCYFATASAIGRLVPDTP